MTIRLHIDRLVLDGLPEGSRDQAGLQQAIEQELATLLGQADLRNWHPAHYRSLQVQDAITPITPLSRQIALNTLQAISPREDTS